MASITLQGNLARDAELRFTQSGKPVLNFTVADTLRRKNPRTGEWEDAGTTWWPVTVWDRAAETLAGHLTKGARVLVTGDVNAREYETRDGEKRLSYDVTGRQVAIIPKVGQGGGQRQAPASDPWGAPAGGGFPNDEPPF